MYCPRCGDEMAADGSTLKCERGEMQLSRAMFEKLNEAFVLKTRTTKDTRFSFEVGGKWFCPGDGAEMIEHEGRLECSQCGASINEFVHGLIELHMHRRESES